MGTPTTVDGRGAGRRVLVRLELFTGVAALAGGALLMIRPDGSLLQARTSALTGSPFSDWFLPGLLLAVLVGGGFTMTALWQQKGFAHASHLSLAAGLGIIAFEAAELAWIGFQPLEAVFAAVGAAIAGLAWLQRRRSA